TTEIPGSQALPGNPLPRGSASQPGGGRGRELFSWGDARRQSLQRRAFPGRAWERGGEGGRANRSLISHNCFALLSFSVLFRVFRGFSVWGVRCLNLPTKHSRPPGSAARAR